MRSVGKTVIKTRTAKVIPKGDEEGGRRTEKSATRQTKELVGDPRFIDGILRCIERRCAILGIDAGKKTAFTDPVW